MSSVNSALLLEVEIKYFLSGLVQDCSNPIANALELLQSCTKPFIWPWGLGAKPAQNKENYINDTFDSEDHATLFQKDSRQSSTAYWIVL